MYLKQYLTETQAVNQDCEIRCREINVMSGLNLKSQQHPEEMAVLAISLPSVTEGHSECTSSPDNVQSGAGCRR